MHMSGADSGTGRQRPPRHCKTRSGRRSTAEVPAPGTTTSRAPGDARDEVRHLDDAGQIVTAVVMLVSEWHDDWWAPAIVLARVERGLHARDSRSSAAADRRHTISSKTTSHRSTTGSP